MYKLLYIIPLLAVFCTFQCTPKQKEGLENHQWQLKKLVEGSTTDLIPADVMITALFQDGQLTGKGGCNSYRATYTNQDHQLLVTTIISTKMFCPANNWETRYFTALEGSLRWQISGNTLTMQGTRGSLVFEKP